jgi:hypothetical protein
MFSRIPEQQMHGIRWILSAGWLLMIASLFYDPWTPALTQPDHPWSPFRLPQRCVQVQGVCLAEQPHALGTTLFWGAVVPSGIFILLVFGHEAWRRICPLSFLSQIPRAIGWQRKLKRENLKTGKIRYELVKIAPESWLGKNYLYVQFGWLFIGLCGRILFFNADRLFLGLWLIFTISAAVLVGYLYSGKSWCQYFCPMAPVQQIYSEPGGLFASKAHTSNQLITQSMCRTVLPDGKEQSACVACQNPCIDIDAERAYWDDLEKPLAAFLRYGYVGLVIGYFIYYYLYAGNWDYYFSGAWSHRLNSLDSLVSPGFYISGKAINIPKLIAVPLTLGFCTFVSCKIGSWVERRFKSRSRKGSLKATPNIIRHRIFTICTFAIFNFFFIFGGRPLIQLLPVWAQYTYDFGLVFLSTLWLYKTWRRSPDLYSRENLASRFRKQLEKLQLNISQYLDGQSLADLNAHEVYILARVLPEFTRKKRHEAYKGVVREALAEGYVNYSSSLAVLQQLREELGITNEEHREVLEELGIEDPDLLNPSRQRNLENQIRLSGYRKALERLILLQQRQATDLDSSTASAALAQSSPELLALRQQYLITPQDEAQILGELSPEIAAVRKSEFLLTQLPTLNTCLAAMYLPRLNQQPAVARLMRESIHHKQALIVGTILGALASLHGDERGIPIAQQLNQFSPLVLSELLDQELWRSCLTPATLQFLTGLHGQSNPYIGAATPQEVFHTLCPLLQDSDPLIQAAGLFMISQLDFQQSRAIAQRSLKDIPSKLVQEALTVIETAGVPPTRLADFPLLEKVTYLFNSDFFHRLHTETLLSLAETSAIKVYSQGQVITEAGDTCRELLLLIEGDATIQFNDPNQQPRTEQLHAGQTLDELEVLAHSNSQTTIVADSAITHILAVPVDAFDALLDSDRDFARRVLELESRQLQRFMHSLPSF